jgi:competence ComEA-like helix-hairpin-helix protein
MFDLTRQERVILIFLTLSFVSGLGVSAYKKQKRGIQLSVRPYKIDALKAADNFIEQQRLININSLKVDELTRLPGVGQKLAQRMLEYRQLHGPFRSKAELMQVKGIGEKKFEQLKDLIALE